MGVVFETLSSQYYYRMLILIKDNNEKKHMKEDNGSSERADIWTIFFNGLAEAVKMLFSIIMAIVVAGSKTTDTINTSTEDKTLHTGYRHNNDKSVHFDNDA